MKNLTFLIALAFLLIARGVSIQPRDDQSCAGIPNFLSPQAYEFGREGNGGVSDFTGQPDLDIPIYTYSDGDFTIPLSLTYDGGGFFPSEREGIASLNWFLNNGGGAIVRQVNGWPDDKPSDNETFRPNGKIAAVKQGASIRATPLILLIALSFCVVPRVSLERKSHFLQLNFLLCRIVSSPGMEMFRSDRSMLAKVVDNFKINMIKQKFLILLK